MPRPTVPGDRSRDHIQRLREYMPTARAGHLARLAGVAHGTMCRVINGERIEPDVEERILSVRPEHLDRFRPRTVPAGPVLAHVARLMEDPFIRPYAISSAAGLPHGTLQSLLGGRTENVEPGVFDALMSVTLTAARRHAGYVDGRATVTRIRALQANRWSLPAQRAECGVAVEQIVRAKRTAVRVETEAAVKAMFDRLGDTLGPSTKAAVCATRLGFRPPIHYDDDMRLIVLRDSDDREPAAEAARRALVILALLLSGIPTRVVGERLGMERDAVTRIARRAKLRSSADGDRQVIDPGQDDLIAAIRGCLDGIAWRERTEVLDDPGIDYVARWKSIHQGKWRQDTDDKAAA